MTNLLKNILDVLPEAQKVAINALISRKKNTNELTSIRSQQEEANRILNSIKDSLGNVILNPRVAKAGEKISSVSHNRNMEEVFLDINALYTNIDYNSRLGSVQAITLNSEYQKSKAAIEKLINDVKVFSLRKKYLDFNEVKYLDFNSSRNLTEITPKASISPFVRLLKSKEIATSRSHLVNRAFRTTSVSTRTYATGLKAGLSKSFPPEAMVDQRPETFWTTLVMSDSAIEQTYERTSRSGKSNRVTVNGPVVEVHFKFSHAEQLNYIRLLPFSDYPVRVIDISYRPSIDSLVYFSIDDFTESSTLDWEEYNFNSIFAHEIRVTIAQENYNQSVYQLPESVVRNTDIFQRIYDAKLSSLIGPELVDSDQALDLLRIVNNYETVLNQLEVQYRDNNKFSASKSAIENYYDFTSNIVDLLKTIDVETTKEAAFIDEDQKTTKEDFIEVRKFEYLLGIREVEMGYSLYSPESYYSSEKLEPQATVSEIQLEVEEKHINHITSWEDDYHKTSIEWNIDIGDGRVLPIHPRNIKHKNDQIPSVKDERLYFEGLSGNGFTRLGGLYSTIYSLKKEGHLIPETEYTVSRETGAIPKLKISMTGSEWYDPEAIYTVDYAVDPSSYNVQVIDRYNSKPLLTPDVFEETGPNNDIYLTKFPFINYEVINLTGYFNKDEVDSFWKFNPPQEDIASGQLKIKPTIIDGFGNILQTGSPVVQSITGLWGVRSGEDPVTLQGNGNLSTNFFGTIQGVNFGYFVEFMNLRQLYEVSGFTNATGLDLYRAPEFTLSQVQSWNSIAEGVTFEGQLTGNISGHLNADYVLGVGVKTDDETLALSQNKYTPISITIGGREAKNITDYEKFEHPAFSVSANKNTNYEFIQAGKRIYFNQNIANKEIKVNYKWLTDYIRVQALLRSNQKINNDLSPVVNSFTLLMNNMVI